MRLAPPTLDFHGCVSGGAHKQVQGSHASLFRMTEKGGLSLRGVAVTTETAETAKTVTVVSWYCIL